MGIGLQDAMDHMRKDRDLIMAKIEGRHDGLRVAMETLRANDDKIEHSEKLKKINDALDDLML